jgi:MFS family permease
LSAFLYLFCDSLLDFGMSGLPVAMLSVLFLMMAYAVLKAEKWQEAGRSGWWVNGALAAGALAAGLGTLTEYAFASVVVPLLVYVSVSFRKQWRTKAGLCLGVFLLVVSPWVARNIRVVRAPFGLSPYEVLEGVGKDTANEIKPGQFQRTFLGDLPRSKVWPVVRKALMNGRQLYEVAFKEIGSNYLIAFFLAALLHRFRDEGVFRLRRFVFWSMLIYMVWLAVVGVSSRNLLNVFMPLVIVYAAAFFYVLFERLQFRTRLLRTGMVALFVAFNAVSFIFTILPPGVSLAGADPATIIQHVGGETFREGDVLLSDAPWAIAWYADRSAIWLPFDFEPAPGEGHFAEKDYLAINDGVRLIAGIYLTQALLQQTPRDMMMGYERYWLAMYMGNPPGNTPLQLKQVAATGRGLQVLISNRPR